MAPASHPKAKPVRKKAIARKRKPAIDSDEEARQNASIGLELDSELEDLLSEEEKGSDDEDTTQAGFSKPRSSHASVAFNLQASPSLRKNQGVKRAAEESLVFNQVCSPSRKSMLKMNRLIN